MRPLLITSCFTSFTVVLLAGAGLGQDADLKQALALEKTVQKAIEKADPSIACILVSRSDLYARFGLGPKADQPGKLGAFDRDALRKNPLFSELSLVDQQKLLKRLDLANPSTLPQSSGSGIVVGEAGLVLTPYHVVYGAARIYVSLAGNKGSYADIYAADPRSDLAMLKLIDTKLQLRPLRLVDGSKAERGQFVIGLARPISPEVALAKASASWGMIAKVHQRTATGSDDEQKLKSIHQHGTLLLTDARVNLGTSGGVLLDLNGDAIGLTTALAGVNGPDANGSMAIPFSPALLRIIDVLKKGEEVEYGFLGVSLRTTGKGKGAVLESVTKGSPADNARLAENHTIVAINGQPIEDNDALLAALSTQLAGMKIEIEARKPGSPTVERVETVLAKYHVPGKIIATEPGSRPYFRGLRVDHASLLVQQPDSAVVDIPRGVLISEVKADSGAAKADLKPGSVITHINDRAVATPAAFYEIVLNHKGALQLTLQASDFGQPAPKVILP